MNIPQYLEEMSQIQSNVLEYIDNEDKIEEIYENLKDILYDYKINDNKHMIKSILYMLTKISNNHSREFDFFPKLEQILLLFKDVMIKYFPNSELFNIFKSNKRLILFLLEQKIISIDKFIVKKIFNEKYQKLHYPKYFSPEIEQIMNNEWFKKDWIDQIAKELPEDFNEKRKIGENDNEICQIIQKDKIEDFIVYVNKKAYPLDSKIEPSIYETNAFLLKNGEIELIEYAAFFGSIQILNYLRFNGIELKSSFWLYAIHCRSAEIINLLKENDIKPSDESYEKCLIESIKCHHNDVFDYIQNNFKSEYFKKSEYLIFNYFKYYNFCIETKDLQHYSLFSLLCKYDYFLLVDLLLKNKNIDINKKESYKKINSCICMTFNINAFK